MGLPTQPKYDIVILHTENNFFYCLVILHSLKMTSSSHQPRAGVRGRIKPDDLAVSAYHPYRGELADALWRPNRSWAYYNIVLPHGMHLECPTLGSPTG